MDWIDDYVRFANSISEPATIFHEWCAVSAIASCLQRKCKLHIGLLRFFPNLYIVLVGPSGKRKGTALRIASDMINEYVGRGISLSCQATTREALIRSLKRATHPVEIDGTPTIDSSLSIISEEFTVFLGYGNLPLITNLTDWHDGGVGEQGVWSNDTIIRSKEEVQGMWVNLLAATTPQALQASLPMEAVGIGLASRIIFVYAETKYKTYPFPVLTPEDEVIHKDLQDRLERMLLFKGEYKVTDSFLDKYSKWYIEHGTDNPFDDPRFSGYIDRRAPHILKLCMIMNASRGGDMTISLADFERAHDLLIRTEKDMPKVFRGFGRRPFIDIVEALMQDVTVNGVVTFEEAMNKYYKEVDNEGMMKIMASLESMGMFKFVIDSEGHRYVKSTKPKG